MKKSFIIVILLILSGHFLQSQPSCLQDVKYALVSLKEVVRAKKFMDECFTGNESSADVWLVRGNVYIQMYEYDRERKSKDPSYNLRSPDAIFIANESFYKALELKPDIKPTDGMLDPKDGQVLSAYPISELASIAIEKQDYNEAVRLLNMVIRSYRVDTKMYALYLAYAFLDLSNCYKAMGDDVNYKKLLLDAVKLNVAEPEIYLNLYDIYRQENDTVKCGEILNQARKVIPDSLSINVKGYELDYYAMLRDTAKLIEAAVSMFEQYSNSVAVINIVAGHMVNNKEYQRAEDMIEKGLAIEPNNFDLNQQMTYRYYYEAIDYDKIKEEKLSEKPRKFTEAEAALNKANEILAIAVTWAEKAYNIYKEDRLHNIMFRQILARLGMPIPEDLQQKVDSYYQH